MLKYSFIFLILLSNLYSESKLTIPKDIDMAIIPIGIERDSYFEIKNNTKDTFILDYINYYQQFSLNISYYGNYIWSFSILRSSDQAPKVILPNEVRTFNYEIYSRFEDSVSLTGGKLKYFIDLGYYRYGSNKLIKDSFNISFVCKNIIDSVFVITSGLKLDFYYCPSEFFNTNAQYLVNLYNKFNHDIILDSIRYYNGDSLVNFYGAVNNRSKVTLPEINIDSLPINIKSMEKLKIGWFMKISEFYEKKAFIKFYLTVDNKHIEIFDSIYAKVNKDNEGNFDGGSLVIKSKINQFSKYKDQITVYGCSKNIMFLDSVTFTDWGKDELQIYSDFGIPLTVDTSFYYHLNIDYIAKKTGKTRGKLIAHFRDSGGNYFYRYCYLTTIVDDINDVELSTENPLAFYPNPASSLATLLLNEEPQVGEEVQIYNSLGILVSAFEVKEKQTQVNTEKFADGIYLARFIRSGKSVKFTVVR